MNLSGQYSLNKTKMTSENNQSPSNICNPKTRIKQNIFVFTEGMTIRPYYDESDVELDEEDDEDADSQDDIILVQRQK